RRSGLHNDRVRVHIPRVLLDRLDTYLRRGVALVDDDDVRHAGVRLARIVRELVARPQGIRDDDVEVRLKEGSVVVTAVPQEDLRLAFRLPQDLLVVHARIDDGPLVDVGLVLLPLLDRRLVAVEIRIRREAFHGLGGEVPVRHGIADNDDLLAMGPEDPGDPPGRLALPAPGADGADRDD